VFAVALTLLVLDLRIPINEAIKTEADLFSSFCSLTPKLLTYFLSFMTLGIFWTGHTVQFTYIHKSDRHLNWISLFFLMLVSLVPFTTAFVSEHLNFKFSIGLYWLNILLLGLVLFFHWTYAYRNNFLTLPNTQKEIIDKAIKGRIIVGQTLYAIGALLCFIDTYLSIFVIILIQLNYALALFSKQGKRRQS